MKTFGLFFLLWLICILISFSIWKRASQDEMIKMILSTQLTYIMYRLIKEESK